MLSPHSDPQLTRGSHFVQMSFGLLEIDKGSLHPTLLISKLREWKLPTKIPLLPSAGLSACSRLGGVQKPINGSSETNTNQSRSGPRPGPGRGGPAGPGNKVLVLDREDSEGLQEAWGSAILQTS